MTISTRLNSYLDQHQVEYDLIAHPHTYSSMETAAATHVSGECIAKAVVVKKKGHYTMVVVPASEHVDLSLLREQLHHDVELATEKELTKLFPDCDLGAIPPIGTIYGIETVWDSRLAEQSEVYFEAGDHEELVGVSTEQFIALMGDAKQGYFGRRM